MWFKNLQIYRLPAPWAYTAEQMEEALQSQAFTPASSNELLRQGWDSPRGNGKLVHEVNKQMLMMLGTEKKLLPGSVINQVAKARAAELEEQQGFPPGKKAMKELKERVADELLPRAFSIRSNVWTWIDPVNGWLIVDAASDRVLGCHIVGERLDGGGRDQPIKGRRRAQAAAEGGRQDAAGIAARAALAGGRDDRLAGIG